MAVDQFLMICITRWLLRCPSIKQHANMYKENMQVNHSNHSPYFGKFWTVHICNYSLEMRSRITQPADICVTAEIRRGKRDRRQKKPQGKNIMACQLLWAAIISVISIIYHHWYTHSLTVLYKGMNYHPSVWLYVQLLCCATSWHHCTGYMFMAESSTN